jgi:hypothetical protein
VRANICARKKEKKMEKYLATAGYWLGVVCTILAILSRVFLAFGMYPPRIGFADGLAMSYLSFFHGAALFFLLAIASWCRNSKNLT